jgi:hypothetical protein
MKMIYFLIGIVVIGALLFCFSRRKTVPGWNDEKVRSVNRGLSDLIKVKAKTK